MFGVLKTDSQLTSAGDRSISASGPKSGRTTLHHVSLPVSLFQTRGWFSFVFHTSAFQSRMCSGREHLLRSRHQTLVSGQCLILVKQSSVLRGLQRFILPPPASPGVLLLLPRRLLLSFFLFPPPPHLYLPLGSLLVLTCIPRTRFQSRV